MAERYIVTAEYRLKKEIEVTVADGADPMNPANWQATGTEHEVDFTLDEVLSYVTAE